MISGDQGQSPLSLAVLLDIVQDGYLFEGPLGDTTDVLHQVYLEEVGRGKQQEPWVRLGEAELQGSLRDGDVDIFGLSIQGFYFDVGVGLEGQQLLADGEVGLSSEGHLEGVFSHQSVYHHFTRLIVL